MEKSKLMITKEDIELSLPRIEEGIVHVVFEKNTIVTLDLAKRLVQERLRISNGKEFPLYIDIRGILSIDSETRDYLSGEEGTKQAVAAAVHVDNPMSKFFANLFLTVNKPTKPLKLFTDKQKALKWLQKQIKN